MIKPQSTFYGRYGLLLLAIYAFALIPTIRGAAQALLSNKNDVKEWLPEAYAETQEFKWFREQFGCEQFVMISWPGCTLDDQRLKLLAAHLDPRDSSGRLKGRNWWFSEVMTGPRVLDRLTAAPSDLPYEEAVARLENQIIGPDGQTTCAVITLTESGAANMRKAVDYIRAKATEDCGVPAEDVRLGGPPVDNVALDKSGEASLIRLGFASAGLGLVIAWWCLRSIRLVVMVFTTGIFGAALALALVKWTGSNMNAILLTMPSLVYVAAMSGAIHLTNYYRETVLEHGAEGAPGRAVRHAALPLGLATGTTAIGLMTLLICELVPIQSFGLYSAIGVVSTLIPLMLFLPSLFQFFPLKVAAADVAQTQITHHAPSINPIEKLPWAAIGNGIMRHWAACGAVCVAVMAVGVWGITRCETSINLMRFFSQRSEIVQHYTWLEQNLGPLVPMEVVIRFDDEKSPLNMLQRMQLVERVQTAVGEMELVGGTMSAVTFAPTLPKNRGWSVKNSTLNTALTKHRERFVESDFLRSAEGEELWRISARVGALNNLDYFALSQEIQSRIKPIITAENERMRSAAQRKGGTGSASGTRSAGRESGVSAGAIRLASFEDGAETPPAENAATLVEAPSDAIRTTVTGLGPLVYKAQRSLMENLIYGFLGDWVTIAIVMMIATWNWSSGLLLTLPAVFPAIVVFGVMGWTGVVIDTGTVMAPAVALGVTVDDVVHFMLWVRTGIRQGLSRRQSIMLAYRGCAQAMYQSWGVIGLGLSVFALSNFTPTQRFGIMMVTLLTAALVGNLVLLPAVLASPLGALYEWRIKRQLARQRSRVARAELAAPHMAPSRHVEVGPHSGRRKKVVVRADQAH
jgi:predicted RND superfamily exporter protein